MKVLCKLVICFVVFQLNVGNGYDVEGHTMPENGEVLNESEETARGSPHITDSTNRITIVELNDDCLYGIMNYLDLGDLNSVGNTHPRFELIIGYYYEQKSPEFINYWRSEFRKNGWDTRLDTTWLNVFRFSRWAAANCKRWTAQKLVLSLKFATLFRNSRYAYDEIGMLPLLKDLLAPFMDKNLQMDDENHIEEFASMLTFYDHYILQKLFQVYMYSFVYHPQEPSKLLEWMHYGYMMVLEKSAHLKNQFTYTMLEETNKIRNRANAYYLRHKESKGNSSKLEYVERFKLQWDLYKGDKLSDEAKENIQLTLARNEVESLDDAFRDHGLRLDFAFARVYCAIRSLSGVRFLKLVDASNLDLALFDLAIEKHENKFVEKLLESLKIECKGSKVLETDLRHQLRNINEFIGDVEGTADDYRGLIGDEPANKEYKLEFVQRLKIEIENLGNATDFSGYIKLLKMCKNLSKHGHSIDTIILHKAFEKLYSAYFSFVDRPKAFDDAEQLYEVDRLHAQFTLSNETDERRRFRNRDLTETLFKNFASLFPPMQNDTAETRSKQRIVLKMMIFLDDAPEDNDASNERQLEIMKILYSMSRSYGSWSKDVAFRVELKHYLDKLHSTTKRLFTLEDVDGLNFVYQPVQISGNVHTDTDAYFCHVNTLSMFVATNQWDRALGMPNLLDNILTLEESIGNAETAEEPLRHAILLEKIRFNARTPSEILTKSSNLKKFVDSRIDLMLNHLDSFFADLRMAEYAANRVFFRSIFVAIRARNATAKAELGDALIQRLRIVAYGSQHYSVSDFYQMEDFDACKQILNI